MTEPEKSRHILITGASGGLGSALAAEYADEHTRLTLWGRDRASLEATERTCRDKGATTRLIEQDQRQLEQSRQTLAELDQESPVAMAFLAAGVVTGTRAGGGLEPVEDACRTIAINTLGTVNLASVLLEKMIARGKGHLVGISSVAGMYPLRDAPAYSASKAALTCYLKAVRSHLSAYPLRVSVVCPGYLDTPMGRRFRGPRPLMVQPAKAAATIRKRLEGGSDTIIFPESVGLAVRLLHLMPLRAAIFLQRQFGFSVEPDKESPAGPQPEPSLMTQPQ